MNSTDPLIRWYFQFSTKFEGFETIQLQVAVTKYTD